MFKLIIAEGAEDFAKMFGGPLLAAAMFLVSLVPQVLGVLAIEFCRNPVSKSRVRSTANWLSLIAMSFQVYAIIAAVIGVACYLYVNHSSNTGWNSGTTRTFVIGALIVYPFAACLLFYKSAAQVPRDYFVFLDWRSLKSIATFRLGKTQPTAESIPDESTMPVATLVSPPPPEFRTPTSSPAQLNAPVRTASPPLAIVTCPACAMRVIPKPDGSCPGCGRIGIQ